MSILESVLNVQACGRTDVGRVRETNQDRYLIADLDEAPRDVLGDEVNEHPLGTRGMLLVVADGMGGTVGGEVASTLCVEACQAGFRRLLDAGMPASAEDREGLLRAAIQEANTAVHLKAKEDPRLRDMGTTCVAVWIAGDAAHLCWVGDSRIYQVQRGRIEQLSRDQTLVNELVQYGLLTANQALHHPHRNIVINALGTEAEIPIQIRTVPLRNTTTFMLCTDGLTNLVRDEEILSSLERAGSALPNAGRELVELALSRGGTDNVTLILARARPLTEAAETASEQPVAVEAVPRRARGRRSFSGLLALAVLLVLAALGALAYFWHWRH